MTASAISSVTPSAPPQKDPVTIGVVFSNYGTFISRSICAMERGKASHVGIVVRISEPAGDELYVLDCTFLTGFRKTPWSKWCAGRPILGVYAVKVHPAVVELALSWVGRVSYNPLENLNDLWMGTLRLFGIRLWHNPARKPWAMNCSDAVMRILYLGGASGAWEHSEDATPQDCFDLVSRNPVMAVDYPVRWRG